ncbi:hypothetical protein RCC89_00370 [Cytophagaceae bacterium ABcell3]|nr:hypothetical protein RCC89_00370 [Cytophagaceae bacterium ABcell3]
MKIKIKKPILVSHITFSVGWLGSVITFLVLAVTGLTTLDNQLSRSAIVAMNINVWFVIVPLCFLSLITGLVLALGTKWGLFRHYWITVKLLLTVGMTFLLLTHLQPISELANVASEASFANSDYTNELLTIIAEAGGAILTLVGVITISIYKPWGKIQKIKKEA